MVSEEAIAAAIADLELQDVPNISETARRFKINRVTLSRRYRGVTGSRAEATSIFHKRLPDQQEQALLQHIEKLAKRGLAPTPQIIRNLICEFLKEPLREAIAKYNITPENIYNFDEKGFLIGLGHAVKRIIPIHSHRNKRITAVQDGSREFISVLAAISADGTWIPPTLIYKGEGDLQDTWIDDFKPNEEIGYFGASPNGWSSDSFGQEWLKIFNRHTQAKAGRGRRLLILDGHSSHINLQFVEYADLQRILIIVLPPHSTHRLQPLDVAVFGPLATAYSQEVDQFLRSGYGYLSVSKRDFWRLFYSAWCKSLTPDNIKAGFAATGIYPLDARCQLKYFEERPQTPVTTTKEHQTPINIQAHRQLTRKLRNEPSVADQYLPKLIRANDQLLFDNEVLQHQNKALAAALIQEKKRRKRGKAMGLFDKEQAGQAQLFSPTKIQNRKMQLQEAEQEKQAQAAQAEQAKLQKAIQKDIQVQEAAERKAQRLAEQQQKREEKEQAKAAAKAQREQERQRKAGEKEAQRLAKEAQKAQSKVRAPSSPSKSGKKKQPAKGPAPAPPAPSVPSYLSPSKPSRSGRTIKPNTRLFS